MSENETAQLSQKQNFVEVYFELQNGDSLIEPVKIFRSIGEQYQVATPVLNGYLLVDKPAELSGTMTKISTSYKLIYAKIGSLQVYHGLADVTGELVPMVNGDRPDQVKPVKLQESVGHDYYVMTDDGVGTKIDNPQAYQPAHPTTKSSLVSLTEAEKKRVDKLEKELMIHPNMEMPDLNDFDDSAQTSETKSVNVKSMSTYRGDIDYSVEESATKPVQDWKKASTEAARQTQVAHHQSENSHVQASRPATAPRHATQASPITLLARALALITQEMSATTDKQKIAALAESAGHLLEAIKTLMKLEQI